jgi:hypothetical protein
MRPLVALIVLVAAPPGIANPEQDRARLDAALTL